MKTSVIEVHDMLSVLTVDEVVQQLRKMNRRAAEVTLTPGLERDEAFYAQQNARLVRNAEEYYRTMFHGRVSSWNLRDSHMAETLYTAVAACHRRDLPARHRTPEPLFLHPLGPAVRCSYTHRRNQRSGAAGRGPGVDRRRGA